MDDQALPNVGPVFTLTKKDSADFDRDGVSRRLGIIPTKTCPPNFSGSTSDSPFFRPPLLRTR